MHPENNLTNLIALFPELSQAEKDGLAAFIESQQSFPFQYIVPSDVTVFTYEQMKDAGWFPEPETATEPEAADERLVPLSVRERQLALAKLEQQIR